MKSIIKYFLENKKLSMPILTFPSTQILNCSIMDLLSSSSRQADGMLAIMNTYKNMAACLNMMDLSVEAEAFGAKVQFEKDEIPNVVLPAINSLDEVKDLIVPKVDDGRTKTYVDGVKLARQKMPNEIIIAGVIGPFSLACRVYDMIQLMMDCYEYEDEVDMLLKKLSSFIVDYIIEYKKAGANGVLMADPAAGLLSPDMFEKFVVPFVNDVIEKTCDEDFVLIYHNCGNIEPLLPWVKNIKADAYHCGNAVDLENILKEIPDTPVMGNINPVDFKMSTKEDMEKNTLDLLNKCDKYKNFIISSGCDIPGDSKLENIQAYFDTINAFYEKK